MKYHLDTDEAARSMCVCDNGELLEPYQAKIKPEAKAQDKPVEELQSTFLEKISKDEEKKKEYFPMTLTH